MHIKHFLNNRSVCALFLLVHILLNSTTKAQDCSAKVEIRSNKLNSLIYVDSTLAGKGNIQLELEKGNHTLLIKEGTLKWGNPKIEDTLKISDCDKKYLFTYELKNRELPAGSNLPFGEYYNKREESFFNSATFKILIGSAAVLGGIAAYYKIRADKKYDDYLLTKNQKQLDEVNRYDLYSGISFGLLQINFGYLIYKFLTD